MRCDGRIRVNDRGIGTPHFRAKGALTHSRCGHSLSCTDEARLEQINLGAAVHLALDEFELGDLAFGLAIRPRRGNGVADCGDVLLDPCDFPLNRKNRNTMISRRYTGT
jgi:hypothetical protein